MFPYNAQQSLAELFCCPHFTTLATLEDIIISRWVSSAEIIRLLKILLENYFNNSQGVIWEVNKPSIRPTYSKAH